MENNKDKVEVLISQERYDELIQREKDLIREKARKTIRLSYKYLDTRHFMSILDDERDSIELVYNVGESVPKEIINQVEGVKEILLERIMAANEYRLSKIEMAREAVLEDIKIKKKMGFGIPFRIKVWLGLEKHIKDA